MSVLRPTVLLDSTRHSIHCQCRYAIDGNLPAEYLGTPLSRHQRKCLLSLCALFLPEERNSRHTISCTEDNTVDHTDHTCSSKTHEILLRRSQKGRLAWGRILLHTMYTNPPENEGNIPASLFHACVSRDVGLSLLAEENLNSLSYIWYSAATWKSRHINVPRDHGTHPSALLFMLGVNWMDYFEAANISSESRHKGVAWVVDQGQGSSRIILATHWVYVSTSRTHGCSSLCRELTSNDRDINRCLKGDAKGILDNITIVILFPTRKTLDAVTRPALGLGYSERPNKVTMIAWLRSQVKHIFNRMLCFEGHVMSCKEANMTFSRSSPPSKTHVMPYPAFGLLLSLFQWSLTNCAPSPANSSVSCRPVLGQASVLSCLRMNALQFKCQDCKRHLYYLQLSGLQEADKLFWTDTRQRYMRSMRNTAAGAGCAPWATTLPEIRPCTFGEGSGLK